MLELFARSRIYIGISESDAISTSMLEAMSCGAFPIQTDTSCADEWISSAESIAIVSLDDVDNLSTFIRIAALNDIKVDQAAISNRHTLQSRCEISIISDKARRYYFDS